MIAFTCPSCKHSMTREDHEAGQKGPCPSCGQRLQVPQPPTPPVATAVFTTQVSPFPQATLATPSGVPAEETPLMRFMRTRRRQLIFWGGCGLGTLVLIILLFKNGALLLETAGVSKATPGNFSKVKEGMSVAAVEDLLGQGMVVEINDWLKIKKIIWESRTHVLIANFKDDKLWISRLVTRREYEREKKYEEKFLDKFLEGEKPTPKNSVPKRPKTESAADEEFRVAASQIDALDKAKILIEFRKRDHWSWDRLESEVDFQMTEIKDAFNQWKRDRIAAGDRYK